MSWKGDAVILLLKCLAFYILLMIDELDGNNSRDIIITELLYVCTRMLSERGMTGMFLDGVSFGEQGLISLGKSRLAEQ
jgi:hypothetical protein